MEAYGVFEGGGIRGIGLAGAASAVLDAGYTLTRLAGTSAGALAASLIAAGYSSRELRAEVAAIRWPSLLDGTWVSRIPIFGRHLAFGRRGGLYRGDRLEEEWDRLLAAKGVHTFADLPPGRLRMVAVDLTHEQGVILPDGLAKYGIDPDTFSVARAARISSSVPFVFQPVEILDRQCSHSSLLADGALGSKFPVELVGQTDEIPVFGFRPADRQGRHRHNAIRGPATLAGAVMKTGMSARETLPRGRFVSVNQIIVEMDRDSFDFDVSPDEAHRMFDRGYQAAAGHLAGTPAPGEG